jgi:hypothetical protein
MLAHITMEEVPSLLLVAGISFVSGGLAFIAGRRSARTRRGA